MCPHIVALMHRNSLHDPHRSHQMQKHKFGVTCSDALFVESAPAPPKHEKLCIDISWPGRTGMHYVTRRSLRMQENKFGVMCPSVFFMEAAPDPPKHENSASRFDAPDAPECTT
jgi:hypothetical protein